MSRTFNAFVAAAILAFGGSLVAQNTVPEIPFDTNADVLKTPTDIFVGEVGGVGTTSKGQIFVYTRTGHPYATLGDNRTFSRGGSRLFQFDQTGKFVRELGQDVYGFNAAIGLRVDPQDRTRQRDWSGPLQLDQKRFARRSGAWRGVPAERRPDREADATGARHRAHLWRAAGHRMDDRT